MICALSVKLSLRGGLIMFKAKRIDNGNIETVLAVDYNDTFHQTYFLVWSAAAWRWRPAHKYVPPNVDPGALNKINVRTEIAQAGDLIDEDTPF